MTPTSCNDLPRLVLIGTVHRDPGTQKHLTALLDTLSPEAITLELSPWAVAWRLSRGPSLLVRLEHILDRFAAGDPLRRANLDLHPEVEAIRALLAFPAEFRCASAWAADRRVPLSLIDLSAVSARKLRRVERELVTEENLRTLLALSPATRKAEGPIAARRLVEGNPGREVRQAFLAHRRGAEGIGVRDRWMARAIRRILKSTPGSRVVHIGGWVHLVEDEEGETLFSRLRELFPGRMLTAGKDDTI